MVDSSVSEADVRKDVAVQVGPWAPSSSPSLVIPLLAKHKASIVVATVLALLLGLIGATLGILIGPCIKILMTPAETLIPLSELFPQAYLTYLSRFTTTTTMSGGALLAIIPGSLVIVGAIRALISFSQWFIWERVGEKISLELRSALIKTFLNLNPQNAGRENLSGVLANLSSHLTTDIKMLREYVVRFYGGLPREVFQVMILGASLYALSPSLFLLFLLGVAPALLAARVIGKRIKRRASAAMANSADLTEWIQQRLLGVETIKHYRSESLEVAKFNQLTLDLYRRYVSAARAKAMTSPVIEAIAIISIVIVLYIALQRIADDQTSGTVFMSFFATLALLSQSAARLGRYLNANREGSAATARLRYALSTIGESRCQTMTLAAIEPSSLSKIVCKKVTIQYKDTEVPALSDFTYSFESGKFYVIHGPSGSGKSSLVKAILGLVKPTAGEITTYLKDTSGEVPFVYLPQQVELLPGSVAQNISYPLTPPDPKNVAKSLAAVGMDKTIKALPEGPDTIVGSGGRDLSGGQAQRLLLARMVYHESPFVVLDEATSALDPELETLTLTLIKKIVASGRLVIMVAHRPKTFEYADVTLAIDKGLLQKSK